MQSLYGGYQFGLHLAAVGLRVHLLALQRGVMHEAADQHLIDTCLTQAPAIGMTVAVRRGP